MSLERPPTPVAQAVNHLVPGVWPWFLNAVNSAIAASPYAGTVQFTSWYRTPQRNAQVGGAASSQHLAGLAVDVVFPSPGARADALWRLQRNGLTVIDEGDHVHLQVFPAATGQQVVNQLRAWRLA